MIWRIILFLIFVFTTLFIDLPTALFSLLIYAIGLIIVYWLNNKTYTKTIIKLYNALFASSFIYLLLCFIYMTYNNYDHLLSYDVIEYFLPQTKYYLSEGNYVNIFMSIWEDYTPFTREVPGYFTILTLFGKTSEMIGSNFYISLQLSSILAFCLSGILIFRLFIINRFDYKKCFKYTLLTSLFSLLFFYSGQILRDMYITLFYLAGIYLTFKKEFSIKTTIKIILIIVATATFRIESGLFLLFLIPIHLLYSLEKSKQRIYVIIASTIIILVVLAFTFNNLTQIQNIYEFNREVYVEGIKEGSGTISTLQKIPILGDFASIIYNALQPIPFWSRFYPPTSHEGDWSVYNIMRFPQAFASLFNFIVIFYIVVWLFMKNVRYQVRGKIPKPLQYNLWIGLLFFLLQSSVITQRRLMGYYCIYYILFFIIYSNIRVTEKKQFNGLAISLFTLMQVVGLIYIS